MLGCFSVKSCFHSKINMTHGGTHRDTLHTDGNLYLLGGLYIQGMSWKDPTFLSLWLVEIDGSTYFNQLKWFNMSVGILNVCPLLTFNNNS